MCDTKKDPDQKPRFKLTIKDAHQPHWDGNSEDEVLETDDLGDALTRLIVGIEDYSDCSIIFKVRKVED